ncbi:DUF4340 domain-containing protein [Rheinheimera sp.]|uniref:DUF4340 domain-containing protein n=1 Tax=Rheinheimera sp. TaxID=1869214 RepID=UPI00307ECFA8
MKHWTLILSLGLAIQLGLTAWLWWPAPAPQTTTLLQLDRQQLNEIRLQQGGQQLVLHKQDGQWRLPALQDQPANSGKIALLLSQLAEQRLGFPVSQSVASHQRFSVADDNYQWKLSLKAGQQQQEWLIGNSPAFKQLYLRQAGQDQVYQVALNSADWSTDASRWFDTGLLQVPALQQLSTDGLELSQQDGKWQLSQPQGQPELADQAAAEQLQRRFASLQVTGPALPAPAIPAQDPVKNLSVRSATGQWQFRLKSGADQYLIQRSDRPHWYPIAKADFDHLAQLRPDQLVAQSKPAQAESETATPQQAEP